MVYFQQELDEASIDIENKYHIEINQFFSASNYTIVGIDCLTNGLLSYQLAKIIPSMSYLGCLSSSSLDILQSFSGNNELRRATGSASYSLKMADSLAHKFNSQIAFALSGILGIPNAKGVINCKLYLTYIFNHNISEKCIECIGTNTEVMRQVLHACFGYLKLLFIKYPINKGEVDGRK